MNKLDKHFKSSESSTIVDVKYLGAGWILEYLIVRTAAVFCTVKKARQPYFKKESLSRGMVPIETESVRSKCFKKDMQEEYDSFFRTSMSLPAFQLVVIKGMVDPLHMHRHEASCAT